MKLQSGRNLCTGLEQIKLARCRYFLSLRFIWDGHDSEASHLRSESAIISRWFALYSCSQYCWVGLAQRKVPRNRERESPGENDSPAKNIG